MIAHRCPKCGSPELQKKGRTLTGQQKYHCKACRRYGTLDTQHTARAHQRGIARITGVSRTTIINWLKKARDQRYTTIPTSACSRNGRSVVLCRQYGYVVWIWLPMDRATRRIVGVAFGGCSARTWQALWDSLPPVYRQRAVMYTDF
jgi:insertion element IS1 protein InsB